MEINARALRIAALGSAVVLQGCVTFLGLDEFATRRGHLMSCPRILQDGDDILLEFRGWDPAEKPEESFFWGRLQRTLFFSAQTVNAVDLKLKLGHIPDNLISKAQDPEKDCLSSRIQKDYLVQLADTCLGRETQLVLGPSYTYRKPWRIFSMPVMIPLAIAADIALIPVYTGYWIKCVTVGCAQ